MHFRPIRIRFSFGVTAIALCVIVGCLNAGWWRTYGEGSGICLQQTDDGGYVITGGEWLLLKLDERGNVEWEREHDTIGYVTCIQQLTDGGYILVTSHNYCVGGKLIKTDQKGNMLWTRYIGWGTNWVKHTSDGGFIVVGEKYHSLSGDPQDWCTTFELLKTDSSGNTLWNKSFGPLVTWSFSGGLCVDEASDSCFVAVGYYGGESWYWLIKTDPLGHLIWERQDNHLSAGITVEQTKDGGYIVGGSDCSLWKTDSSGNKVWRNVYDGYSGWSGPSVQQTPDEGYIMVARTPATDSNNGGDLLLIKIDSVGNTLWSHTYGEVGWDGGNAVRVTKDSGYVALGWLSSADNKTQYIYLIKTDSLGLVAVSEPVTPVTQADWQVSVPIGPRITLRAPEGAEPLNLTVFDASGRLVDEIRLAPSSTISWGEGMSPGVYFIKSDGDSSKTSKIVLVK